MLSRAKNASGLVLPHASSAIASNQTLLFIFIFLPVTKPFA